jgi:hypothetical protein
MKLHLVFAAALILICSGCVAYTYSDPYYNDYYPYRNHYYYGYGPSYYPYGSLFYPNIYLDYSIRSHRHHGPYRDRHYRGYRH